MTGPAGDDGGAARVRQEAADWFARLRAGPGEAELAAFETWRAADTLNGETYDRLARQWEQSKFLANTALGRTRDLDRARAWHRRPSARYAAVAATLVLAVGLGWLVLGPGAVPNASVDYASDANAIRTLALADGSRVTLDRGSMLRVSYSPTERELDLLRGRARFDVAHDTARPFVVRADGGSVVAHGTVFEVELRPAFVRVVLLRGSVEVRALRGNAAGADRRMLAPGQAITFAHGEPLPPPTAASPEPWSGGMLSFDGTPLREAVAGFNRRNAVKLRLGSARIADLRVTGAFAADDPAGFADAAGAMFRLDVRRAAPDTIALQ